MATILYFPSSGSAPVSPTPAAADWTLHVNTVSRPLNFTRGNTALTTLAYNPDGADHIVDGTSMIAQFVSQILPPQTINAQQVCWGARALEAAASNNLFPTIKIYGCSVDGTTNLGNIKNIFRSAVAELATAITGVCEAFATTGAVTFNVPWRLVVEIGVGGLPVNTATDTHNASFAFGDPLATGAQNLPQNADTTACTPVLIFSEDIITSFGSEGASFQVGI